MLQRGPLRNTSSRSTIFLEKLLQARWVVFIGCLRTWQRQPRQNRRLGNGRSMHLAVFLISCLTTCPSDDLRSLSKGSGGTGERSEEFLAQANEEGLDFRNRAARPWLTPRIRSPL